MTTSFPLKGLKKYFSANYHRLLLSYGLSLAIFMLIISVISFVLVFSQAEGILEQTEIYEYIYDLSSSLHENTLHIEEWIDSNDFATSNLDIQASLPRIYGNIEHLRFAMSTYNEEGSPFLRGIENGLAYVLQKIPKMNNEDNEVAKYLQAQHILHIYGYLIRYTDTDILSLALEKNVRGLEVALEQERFYRFWVLTAIFLILALYVFFSFRITKRLSSPIQEMVYTANEISQGNLDVPDIELSNTSEIRLLENTINKMKQNLKNNIQMMEEKATLTAELNAARMSALQAQIQPHFLFNTLNIINRTANQEQAEKTQELIHALSGIFRYNLEYRKTVSLQEEIDFIEQYMYIQQSRFSDRISYSYECNCDISNVIIPPFTLQPLVENAVIHGLSEVEEGGEIAISIQQEKKKIKICISDTGIGASEEQIKQVLQRAKKRADEDPHIGVKNVINRLQLYYNRKASIKIEQNKPSGLIVTIVLPILGDYSV